MKKYPAILIVVLCLFPFFSINAGQPRLKVNCYQLRIQTRENMMDLGFDAAEAEDIANSAYIACRDSQEED